MQNKDLNGKVALITGAARNMGRAFALALAERGANIVVHYHSESSASDAEETARLVKDAGTEALLAAGDLAQASVVESIFADAQSQFGRIDIVINNAGIVVKKPIADCTEDDFDRSFGINAKAAFFVMQQAAKNLQDNGRVGQGQCGASWRSCRQGGRGGEWFWTGWRGRA